ncbi:PucR family transcriptional regulator [Millisia brevis]|uniref:PucR family transcriptional regulator n=1 Tax=Millisia brevis TaxID=264148 RepID=UPI00083767ED|nr:PucR family transcriptional regulator [Millisia brevis]
MTFGPMQDLVDALAERLTRSVVVEDHTLHLVAFSKDYGDADSARVASLLSRRSRPDDVYYARLRLATGPTAVEGNDELAFYARLAIPIRYEGMLLGFVWLIDRDGTLTDPEVDDSVTVARRVGELLHRRLVARDADDAQVSHLVERVIHGDAPARSAAAADILGQEYLEDDSFIVVVTARFPEPVDDRSLIPAAVQNACRRLPPRTWIARSTTREATVIVARRRPPTDEARSVADALCTSFGAGGHDFGIGVSSTRQSLADAATCHRQAEIAVAVTERRSGIRALGFWDELGPYRLIGQLPTSLVTNPLLPRGVFRLLRSNDAGQLVSTAEMFLDCGGDKQQASQRLSIHRSTMYYRLDRIATITGLNLDDGNDRLLLHLAIKLWRLDAPDSLSPDG